jgi:CheY-like chemotaxis protein
MSPKRILVIDDEYAIQLVVRGCLEDLAGWNVITASSGREGLAKAQIEHPDAILLDVMMPEMDGVTLLQQLQSSPDTGSIPVVLLTAKMEFTDFSRLAICGVVGAIAKPFDSLELVEQIASFLNWEIART